MLDHIGQIPAHAARIFQDKEALVFEGRSFTFNELNELIEKSAAGLDSLGTDAEPDPPGAQPSEPSEADGSEGRTVV